jgi:hypothetical protein
MGRSIQRNLALPYQIDVRSRSRAMSVLLEMIGRGWENFLARPNGSMSLRFYVQPTMASLLALRAGIQDAREGRQGYLWAILTRPERRLQLLHEGWRGAMTPFLLAVALDCIYQLMTVRFVYPLELLFTATLLALVPYALLRGPFNRLARLFLPAAPAPPVEPTRGNHPFTEETHQGRATSMSSESKTQDWSNQAEGCVLDHARPDAMISERALSRRVVHCHDQPMTDVGSSKRRRCVRF